MKRRRAAIERLEERHDRVLDELHPELRARVLRVLADLGGRVSPWEGYRDAIGQAKALARGSSRAKWGQSPHNYSPALACDLVLHPERHDLRAHKDDAEYPDLWDDESLDALATWAALEEAAQRHGLERVTIRDRITGKLVRDKPHVQVPMWRAYVTGPKAAR
jgi:hypothetical protein